MKPVYPKEDPVYRKSIMDQFYKKVRETKWDCDYDEDKPKRGRQKKNKFKGRPDAKPRENEKYNWLND